MTDTMTREPPRTGRPRRPRRSGTSRSRRTAIVVIALVVVPMVILASGALWFWWQLDPPGNPGAKVELEIQRGWGVPRIGDELNHAGVIGSPLVFSIYARLNGDSTFEAGSYELRKHMGVRAAVNTLKAGPRLDYTKVTIPPGLWVKEIAQRIGKLPGLTPKAFLDATTNNAVRSAFEPEGVNNLEGLLWPDTYKLSADEDEIQALKTMSETFEQKAFVLGLPNANVNGYGPYDIIKVASLVEAEAKTAADRPLIASVIYNRLKDNMPLQIDATLIYARGDPSNRKLSDADKGIDSPYNTYTHNGLPPTPIAGVSEASLRAALAPAQTNFLYYVVKDKQGDHAFAATLARAQPEHRKGPPSRRPAVIGGDTRVAAVIGDPVRHSLSPVLHNTAYAELDLDWVYVAFEVPDGATKQALEAMRALGIAGFSVTMPHKTAAAAACDELTDAAEVLRSVNTVTLLADGRLRGDSTDGAGFLRALDAAAEVAPGARVSVLGAGGAARAVVRALAHANARVIVCARRLEAARAAAALGPGATACPWEERADAVRDADIVVNATPIGMGGDARLPVPLDAIRAGQVVADLVYHPLETPLLAGARARAAFGVDGLGMLVHQAALQVEQWTGRVAPVALMRAAAVARLAETP